MSNDPNSPFNWRMRTEPSIFAQDPYFRPKTSGKTASAIQSEVISKRVAKGQSPGTIHGLGGAKAQEERMLAYKHFGTYSRATPSIKRPNKHEE